MKNHKIKKLQLGAGHRHRESWLCSDIIPKYGKIIFINSARPLPFNDNTFDYVFSEHMIEHIPYRRGAALVQECFRILKPGGKLRIATPDLSVILSLHNSEPDPSKQEYIKWITDKYIGGNVYEAPLVIANAYHNWGHQVLYDPDMLRDLFENAGFINIKNFKPSESDDESLKNLECHGHNVGNEEMNRFETMVLEGTRPE